MLKVAWSEIYKHPLPDNHRFPMEKYELLPEQLLYEGVISSDDLFQPKPIAEEVILETHEEEYWNKLSNLLLSPREQRKTGFPHSDELILRERVIMQGTIDAALYALEHGIGMNSAGGTHHAFTNRGEGFCLLNDIAIAANFMLNRSLVKRVLVLDLDVHQGNGTAQIFRQNNQVYTVSFHGEKNYPLQKEFSDLDIGLKDQTTNQEYLNNLTATIKRLEDEYFDFVFYQSGVDVLSTDKLGRLALTIEGCKERDRIVLEWCKHRKLPVCITMGGGYSENIKDIIEAHANTYRLAQQLFL